jgi:hypothetical protein
MNKLGSYIQIPNPWYDINNNLTEQLMLADRDIQDLHLFYDLSSSSYKFRTCVEEHVLTGVKNEQNW